MQQEDPSQKTLRSLLSCTRLRHRALCIFLTTPLSYTAIAFYVGQYEKLLRDGKLATGYELKTKPREFLASTGLKRDEFEQLLPAFRAAYEKKSSPDLTQEGTPRQRQFGGGAKGTAAK